MIERTFIEQNMKRLLLEKYFQGELARAGFIGLDISKTPLVTRIVLHVTRPGLAIGRKGKTIRNLSKELETTYKLENPQIEIAEVSENELHAKALTDRVKNLLERGYSWRSVLYRTVEDAMDRGAQGIEIVLKGKLSGKGGRKKKERVAKGYMKKSGGLSHLVDYAKADAFPKPGAIGVKVRLIRPGVKFPDKFTIDDLIASQEGRLREQAAAPEEAPAGTAKETEAGAEKTGEKKEAITEKALEAESNEKKPRARKAKATEEGNEKEKGEESQADGKKGSKTEKKEEQEGGKAEEAVEKEGSGKASAEKKAEGETSPGGGQGNAETAKEEAGSSRVGEEKE